MIALLRAVAALVTGSIVFVAGIWIWPSILEVADGLGGKTYIFVANHIFMALLGIAIGSTVMLIAVSGDFITPSVAGVALFVLGLLGMMVIAAEPAGDSSIDRTIADVFLCWGGYAASAALVFLGRHKRLSRERSGSVG